ncbi:MAG: hypothetical protein AAFO94_11100 [Bacteroidota bacterium]
MAKDFKKRLGSKNLDSLIPTNNEEPAGSKNPVRSKSSTREPNEEAVNDTEVTTFRVNREKVRSIRAIAFWDRKKVQDVFDEALSMYIDQYPKTTLNRAMEEYDKRKPRG